MGMGSGGRRKGRISEINVTPMVDVMLVLLIIFMVAAGVQRGAFFLLRCNRRTL